VYNCVVVITFQSEAVWVVQLRDANAGLVAVVAAPCAEHLQREVVRRVLVGVDLHAEFDPACAWYGAEASGRWDGRRLVVWHERQAALIAQTLSRDDGSVLHRRAVSRHGSGGAKVDAVNGAGAVGITGFAAERHHCRQGDVPEAHHFELLFLAKTVGNARGVLLHEHQAESNAAPEQRRESVQHWQHTNQTRSRETLRFHGHKSL
jgi:hypothetical protein